MKALVWVGASRQELVAFPASARRDAGYQLDKVQRGVEPDDWKPLPRVGPGVREIRVRDEAGAFRVVYVASVADVVYVLHALRKKTQRTALHDLQLAEQRFNLVKR